MSKQTINIGSGELVGNGESIRSAFNKVNNNFDELYSQGVIGYTGSIGGIGEQGPLGYTGSIGPIGYAGSVGDLGYTGSIGLTGYTGSIGPIGYAGSVGDLGYTGSIGLTGYTGSMGVSIPESKTFYVSLNGNDLNDGNYTYNAFRTLKHALSQSSSGDLIKVSAGLYAEEFPLLVPQGVCVKGAGLRSTEIMPTLSTKTQNGFILNGESTVEDLTVKGILYDNILDRGYTFVYNTNTNISIRSPYIQRVTVINTGSITTPEDPYGFLSGDAGRGALIDGKNVTRNSLHASMLFNEVTFIVPNSRGLIMTNGARSEFLNCFTYFAQLAIEGKVGIEGRSGNGKTYIELDNITGTFDIGDTIDYYSSIGELLSSHTIVGMNNSAYILEGSASGYATYKEGRPKKTITPIGTTLLGEAATTSTQSMFGGQSLFLNGSGTSLRVIESVIPSLGNFTAEAWIYPESLSTPSTIFFLNGNNLGYAGLKLSIEASTLHLRCSTNGSAWDFEVSTSISFAVDNQAWSHVSVSRNNNEFIVHLNGTPIITNSDLNSTAVLFSGNVHTIGSDNTINGFYGYIDEVRISNISRYSSTSFPTTLSPYINDNNVSLLLHFDGTLLDDDGPIIQDIRSSGGATATRISRYDRSEFAAELRAFSCANVYGIAGVKADGPDVRLNLIAHNFGYIGTGYDLSNNRNAIIQSNEILETNGGKIYYDTVDQDGNYRIGDLFTVNFESGTVSFQGPSFDVTNLTGITFSDGLNTTIVNPTGIQIENLSISENAITSSIGGFSINVDPNSMLSIVGSVLNSGGMTIDGKTTILAPVPVSSIGSPGDQEGLIAFSSTHIYRCNGSYDGFTNIWKRISWSNDTW